MTTTDPHTAQGKRAADWCGWRKSDARVCPRTVAGKRCKVEAGDRRCLCRRHRHLLDHARIWLDPEGRHVFTGEPYDIDGEDLNELLQDLAALRLHATLTGRSMWNPGYTLLIIITKRETA